MLVSHFHPAKVRALYRSTQARARTGIDSPPEDPMTQTATIPVAKTAAASSRAFQTNPGDHRFFSAMASVSALTILAGFSSTYVPKLVAGAPAHPPLIPPPARVCP